MLLPFLSPADSAALFEMGISPQILAAKDNGVQKRGYKILAKLMESGKVPIDAEKVLGQLDEVADGLMAAAKKVSGPSFS